MTKEVEEGLVYTGGHIPPTDLMQDDIDKVVNMVKNMADRRDSTESEEEVHTSDKQGKKW